MKHRLLPAFAIFALSSPALAEEDSDETAGETPEQKEERLASQAGKFNAGLKVRFPSGPDDMGEFGTFNFVAVDLHGKYNVTSMIGVGGTLLTAPVKPEGYSIFGGFMARPELRLGQTIGAFVDVGFLKAGAVLLSDKDYPAYVEDADYEAAARVGPWIKLKANVVYLSFQPQVVYQAKGGGEMGDESILGAQVPINAMLRAGEALKVSADLGIYTGDDFKMGAKDGGRIAIGAAVDIKVGHIAIHLGTGLASLLTSDEGGLYPSIGKSLYFDVNAKYVK